MIAFWHDFTFAGELTAYGRGLDLEAARTAGVMEVFERCSSFASVDAKGVEGYANLRQAVHGRLSNLRKDAAAALDPNTLALEAPYQDEPLYWLEARE